ncbi:MAG TPA: phosphoenolpyruvate--protein phosphotransferase, partial [Candidatus Limnocylindria bacterium]|nr:phosphoenolpyruvate--protein phosphotransferase [Candidatus Limnocylindria bacterium]
ALMAEDPELLGAARVAIGGGASASAAIVAAGEEQAAILAAIDDEVLAARAADVRDVAERIARAIRGQSVARLPGPSVAVAGDLPPSVTAELDPALLQGIALEAGSPTAHAAILARALGIPATVGVTGLLDAVEGATEIGVVGDTGEVVVDPDGETTARLRRAMAAREEQRTADAALRTVPLATADGHRVTLLANVGRPEESQAAADAGAEGIGLFRTEFLFMGRTSAPSIAAQAAAYAEAFAAFPGRPVVVRTLDIGGDKQLPYLRQEPEENPFLGVRAIRLAAREPNRTLLVDQLRAILAAAAQTTAEVWVMAPMVADLDDVALVRGLLEEAGGAGASVKVGIMVELPAAVLLADQLAARVDFFSIGTNDLTQYTLAVDRTNAALAARQDPMHPAVLRAIGTVVDAAKARGIPVAVCGEMAGDPAGAVVLAGLGIDELSMDPRSFGPVKRAVGAVTRAQARVAAAEAAGSTSAEEARRIIDALLRTNAD